VRENSHRLDNRRLQFKRSRFVEAKRLFRRATAFANVVHVFDLDAVHVEQTAERAVLAIIDEHVPLLLEQPLVPRFVALAILEQIALTLLGQRRQRQQPLLERVQPFAQQSGLVARAAATCRRRLQRRLLALHRFRRYALQLCFVVPSLRVQLRRLMGNAQQSPMVVRTKHKNTCAPIELERFATLPLLDVSTSQYLRSKHRQLWHEQLPIRLQ
jgi:hypothetical protein